MLGLAAEAKVARREMERRETARRAKARAARTTTTVVLAGARVRAPRSSRSPETTARSTHTWPETALPKEDVSQKQKNVGAIEQSFAQSTSSAASVDAVALTSSQPECSLLGRLVMAIAKRVGKVDAYQVFQGTRPGLAKLVMAIADRGVVMMAIDSGSEIHTAPVKFP